MYIRWVVRRHKNATLVNTNFHDAYLVESYRDESGNPRQRTICYLGNIRQIDDDFPAIERELFLLRADRILESVELFDQCQRNAVLDMLQQKVRPLSATEVRTAFVENIRWYCRWWAQSGTTISEEDLIALVLESQHTTGPLS